MVLHKVNNGGVGGLINGTKHEIESQNHQRKRYIKPISHFDIHLLKEAMKTRIV